VSLLSLEVVKSFVSKLLKAYKVVSTYEPKIVALPTYDAVNEEENEVLPNIEAIDVAKMKSELEQELSQKREQALRDLAAWRKQEEEQFQVQLEEEKKRGYQEGYEMGMDEGRNHGLLQYQELIQKAKGILEQAYEEKMAVIQEAEPFVIGLSVGIADKILQQELKTNEEALLPMIKQSLTSVYESTSLTLNVSPEDYPFVQKQREQLLAVMNGKVEVKIMPDYSIRHGGCIIHTSSGSVDARIDVQLSEIKKALLSYLQEDHHE
jgi:flagellar assembly protein FliH